MSTSETITPKKSTLKELLGLYKKDIESELENLFKEYKDSFHSEELFDSVKYSVLNGGKRLRAILSLITAEAIRGEEKLDFKSNPASGLALAIELIHSGSLIHDDLPCMDDDDLRRGKASNHIKFGEANALLAGDFLMTFPLEVLITKSKKQNINSERINEAVLKLNQAIRSMISGQAIDINSSDSSLNSDELKLMEELKTGALLKASIEISALLAEGKEDQINSLIKYAENIGLAFQIADDILDHTQNTETLGKTPGKDKEQNKLTYLNKYGLEKSQEMAKALITEAKASLSKSKLLSDKLELIADYVISRVN